MIFWLYGQPAAGKTTLAKELARQLQSKHNYLQQSRRAINIDGDDIRLLYKNDKYDHDGRVSNIRMAQNLAKFLNHSGHDPIVSLVTPLATVREEFFEEMKDMIIDVYLFSHRSDNHEYWVHDYEYPMNPKMSFSMDDVTPYQAAQEILAYSVRHFW